MFRKGVQFTEQLLAENERLRFRVAQLEQEQNALAEQALGKDTFRDLIDKMSCLEDEKQLLMQRFASIEGVNRGYSDRYREMEAETDRMANLYVAIYQLHSTLDVGEAVRISFEILINLVGAARFALYIADGRRLNPVRTHGLELSSLAPLEPAGGVIAQVLESREMFLADASLAQLPSDSPAACVPLLVADRVIGLFLVDQFLPQKDRVSELDHELLRLVSTHAGMALFSSALSAKVGDRWQDVVEVLIDRCN